MQNLDNQRVVLYDGSCGFCHQSVKFLLDNEGDYLGEKIKFASLQSEYGKSILEKNNIVENPNSVVYSSGDKIYLKSDAALQLLLFMKSPWKQLYYLKYVPRFIRNFIYDIVAKYRKNIAGEKDECDLPSPERRERFI